MKTEHMVKKHKNKGKRNSRFSVKLDFSKVDWSKTEKIFIHDQKSFLNRLRKGKLLSPQTKEILKILAGGAVIGLSFVIPVTPMAMAPFFIDGSRLKRNYFSQTINRLRKQKLVQIIEENGQTAVRITEEGRMRALRYKLYEMEVKRPKRWDGKWRMVIFDIPEKYKRMREIFRNHLKLMEFYPLQKSVWVHPFPCFDEVEFLRQIYHVGVDVTYVVAERIEGTEDLKERFDLL